MKIISGKYKGKKLKGFDIEGTRPTMDRVKESLFAMIQNNVKNSIVLDLFSGSGALGIEAISNGCSFVYFVDNNKNAINIIKYNLSGILDSYKILKCDYNSFLKNVNNVKFDIVFLDPPYNTNYIENVLNYLNNNLTVLSDNAIIVCETTKNIDYLKYNNLIIYKQRKYNDKNIVILKNER